MTKHRIGDVSELDVSGGRTIEVDGIEMALFEVDGEYVAISNKCPHKGAPLSAGDLSENLPLPENNQRSSIFCPWHSMEFELKNGVCPATGDNIGVFDVEVNDGQLVINL